MFRFFEHLVDPFGPYAKTTPPKGYFAYLWSQVSAFRGVIPWLMLAGMVVALMETGLIFYSGRLIDLMTAAGADSFFTRHGAELVLIVLFIMLMRPILVALHHLLLNQTWVPNIQDQVHWRAHNHLLGQSTGFFQNDFAGRLSNRVMQLGHATETSVYMMFEALWYVCAYLIGAAILMAQADMRLWIPLFGCIALYAVFTIAIARRVEERSEKLSNARSALTGRIVDAYTNIETVKLFAHGESEAQFSLSAMRRHRLRLQSFMRMMTVMAFGQTVLNSLMMFTVLGTAIYLWQSGAMSIGEVAAISALVIRLNGMSAWIMWITIELFQFAGTIRESLQSVSVPHAITDAPDAGALRVDRGQIEFQALTHHYGKTAGGLDAIDLVIKPGEKIGLVGRSGAGKSSLVNLLLRFFDVEQGRILIDGQDISAMTQASLRAHIGMVTQDSSLLHRSVRANITYGRPSATEAQMIEAAQRAEAHDFVQDLEDPKGRTGYSAHVGERGVKLSGGQRQRIAIARVILKDAPILVLDEATSALDSEVEASIQNTLYGLMEGKTVIAIAHRLSTIAQMDRIIVMDAGRIVEEGTHQELLAKGGQYAAFWNRQSGGFLGYEAGDLANNAS